MSLQNTVLPDFMLADLFRFSLIQPSAEANQTEQLVTADPALPVVYQGKNLHRITIGVHFPAQELMPAEALDFLVNILKACQRNTDHVAIVNFAAADPTLDALLSELHPRIVLLFGSYPLFSSVTPEMADFTQAELKGIIIVRIPGLDKLMQTSAESKVLKGRLWLMLKQLFNL